MYEPSQDQDLVSKGAETEAKSQQAAGKERYWQRRDHIPARIQLMLQGADRFYARRRMVARGAWPLLPWLQSGAVVAPWCAG